MKLTIKIMIIINPIFLSNQRRSFYLFKITLNNYNQFTISPAKYANFQLKLNITCFIAFMLNII